MWPLAARQRQVVTHNSCARTVHNDAHLSITLFLANLKLNKAYEVVPQSLHYGSNLGRGAHSLPRD